RPARTRRPRGPKRGAQKMSSDSRHRPRGENKVLPNGEFIAQLRNEKGWRQQDLVEATARVARETGNQGHEVGERTLQKIERGRMRFHRERLEGIAQALGVPVELLIRHERPAV